MATYRYAQLDGNLHVKALTEHDTLLPAHASLILLAEDIFPALDSIYSVSTGLFTPYSPSATILSKLEFLRRFTAEERIAIRASVNTSIIDFMAMMELAEYIDLNDADTIAGTQYAEYLNLIASGRATTILTP